MEISEQEYKELKSHSQMLGIIGTYVEDFSEDKWNQIIQSLEEDSKIKHTCSRFIPNFLNQMLPV